MSEGVAPVRSSRVASKREAEAGLVPPGRERTVLHSAAALGQRQYATTICLAGEMYAMFCQVYACSLSCAGTIEVIEPQPSSVQL
jgi:hypothetical protein